MHAKFCISRQGEFDIKAAEFVESNSLLEENFATNFCGNIDGEASEIAVGVLAAVIARSIYPELEIDGIARLIDRSIGNAENPS